MLRLDEGLAGFGGGRDLLGDDGETIVLDNDTDGLLFMPLVVISSSPKIPLSFSHWEHIYLVVDESSMLKAQLVRIKAVQCLGHEGTLRVFLLIRFRGSRENWTPPFCLLLARKLLLLPIEYCEY